MQFKNDMNVKEFAEFASAEEFHVVDTKNSTIQTVKAEHISFTRKYIRIIDKFVIEMKDLRNGRSYDNIYMDSGVLVFNDMTEALNKLVGRREEP